MLGAVHLHAHLHHAPRSGKRLPHAPGVSGIEGHGLLLIHVFARLDRGHEVQGVLVLRGGDENRIDRLVVQQSPVIVVGLDGRGHRPGFVQAPRINIGHGNRLGVRAANGDLEDLLAAAARANQAEADSVIGAQHRPGRNDSGGGHTGGAASQLTQECSAMGHDVLRRQELCAGILPTRGLEPIVTRGWSLEQTFTARGPS